MNNIQRSGDFSKAFQKLVLGTSCCIVSTFDSVEARHSVILKVNMDLMKVVLDNIWYNEDNWAICRELKVISLLFGL